MSFDDEFYIPDLVHTALFPVYGLIDYPGEFSIHSCSRGDIGDPLKLNSIEFIFSSSRYPEQRNNFLISSSGSDVEQNGNFSIVYDLKDPSEGPLFDFDTSLFQLYGLSDKERVQAGSPSVLEETLSIADITFSTKIRHWSYPYQLSLFLLKAGKTVLTGRAFGPSYNELKHLISNLQIINNRNDVLMQYQYEFNQERERMARKAE